MKKTRKLLAVFLFISALLMTFAHTVTVGHSAGDGRLLKRSSEETCHSCHKTYKNAPSDPNSIKTHSNTSSTKWGGSWGVAGSKYGEIICTTCHTAHDTKNIYLLKGTVTAPNGTDVFPGSAVDFRYKSGTAGVTVGTMGDDTGGHAVSSKICEVCHSQNKYHNYNSANNSGGNNHYNAQDCLNCHSHKQGFKHGGGTGTGCGTSTTCHGTRQSHPTHVNNSGGKGLSLDCSTCHNANSFPNFRSKADPNATLTLAQTDICNDCHSAGGAYDGVNNAAIGAKNNWDNGVYSGGSLIAGKEKWCASCHDESPSVISGVTAPNVAGNESGSYTYGTGWGYYKTGHGLPSGQTYPASGGITAGANLECNSCHDFTTGHIDGNARTFDCGNGCDSTEYRTSYRLKLVGGQEPMFMPWPQNNSNDTTRYRLCVSCHNSGPFTDSGNNNTNFRTAGANRHEYHLTRNSLLFPADYNYGSNNSRTICVNCHNVHGSTRMAMVNDGKLIGREPGFQIYYAKTGITTYNPPNPPNEPGNPVTLAASDGIVWAAASGDNICTDCHGGNYVKLDRTPYQNPAQAPTLAWTGETGYTTDGVNPDSGESGSNFVFKVKYTDTNNDAPTSIQVWVDQNDNGTYEEGEKYNMTAVDAGDTNYTDGKLYTKTLALTKAGDNTFNYRFYASDGSEATGDPTQNKTVSITNNVPALTWTGENGYVTDGVNPDTGGNGSNFEFRVKYTDLDNTAPTSIQAWVDLNDNGAYEEGEKFNMTGVDGGDTNYADGKLYSYTSAISYAGDGDLRYRFYASDGIDSAAGSGSSDGTVTVSSSANTPPSLSWASAACLANGVRPSAGATGGDFEFRVQYTDMNNTAPSSIQAWIDLNDNGTYEDGEKFNMTEVDAGDTNYADGKLYKYVKDINYAGDGIVKYRFYASDGTDAAVGDPIADNTLTVVNGALKVRPTGGAGWYDTISGAISASTDPSTILVYPNSDFTAATYAGGITLSSKSNRTLQSVCGADLTIISGGTEVIQFATSNGGTLDGFTITGGSSRGVYVNNSNNFTLKNSKAHTNGTYGVYFLNTCNPASVQNSSIYSNTSGGVYVSSASLLSISNSSIYSNGSSSNGAGILYGGGGTHTITNTTIRNNSTTLSGGAIYIGGGSLTITNTIITGNQAGTNGGAICTNTGPTVSIINSTVADNQGSTGGGIYVCAAGSTEIRNSIFWNNTSTGGNGANIYKGCGSGDIGAISYSNISTASPSIYNATFTDSGGNINPAQDPNFVNPATYNYRIQSGSPCKDAIPAASYNGPADDIDGNSRQQNTNYDMGADEYMLNGNAPALAWTGEANYTADGVNPDSGAGGTSFEFRVKYTDADNNAPTVVQVWVDKNDDGVYDAGEKFNMTAVDGGDTDYTDGKLYTKTMNLLYAGDGNIRYRFYATDGTNEATGSPTANSMVVVTNNAPTLAWTGEADYTTDGVNPDSGPNGANFTFRVKYTDADNTAPSVIQVWVDANDNGSYEPGEKYDMTKDGGDGDYTNGEIYQKALTLYRAGDGALNYRFYASDGTGAATGSPASDSTVTVTNNVPTLAWKGDGGYVNDGSDPDSGTNGTSFIFKVKYTDADNNAPSVIQVWVDLNDNGSYEEGEKYAMTIEGGDSDYTNGEIFTKTLIVNHPGSGDGVLNYRFYAHDGADSATGTPTADKTITISGSNHAPVLSWAAANCLTEGVRPRTGPINGDFEFRVTYSDEDNNCPSTIQVTVNGTPYDLTSNDGASCQTGRAYYRTIAIATAGDLNYSFSASDGTDSATGTPTSNKVVSVINTSYKVRPAGGAGWYSTIGDAVTASADPSTILVYPNSDFTAATYANFALSAKNNRTFQSVCGADLTIVSGGTYAVSFTNSNAGVVDGFSITGGSTNGVYLNCNASQNFTLKNSKVYSNTGQGVYETGSCVVNVQNTKINNNGGAGIYMNSNSSQLNVTSNTEIYSNSGTNGAGIYIFSITGTTHTVTNTTIRNNTASGFGGGIYCNVCTMNIEDSTIKDNTASSSGGALYCTGTCTFTIDDSTINGNKGSSGGAFYFNSNGLTANITDTFIQGNEATGGDGGAIYGNGTGNTNMTNVMLTGNKSSGRGGAVYNNWGSTNCTFCTISGNYSGSQGGGIYILSNATSTLKNSIVYNNNAASPTDANYKQIETNYRWTYMDVYNTLINQAPGSGSGNPRLSYEDLGGNLTGSNPNFVSGGATPPTSATTPTPGGDFRLQSGSPAVNAGSASYTSDHDIFDGTPGSRPKGGAYDMGAHEKE